MQTGAARPRPACVFCALLRPCGYAKVESCGALFWQAHLCGHSRDAGWASGGSSQGCLSLEARIPGPRLARAGVAQSVEHLICNQRVGGSNPFASSTYSKLQSESRESGNHWTDLVVLPAGSGPQTSHHSFKAFSRTVRIRTGAGVSRQGSSAALPGGWHEMHRWPSG